ncbi:MAG: ferredoxin family protein [Eubacteriales bacterium]|nr:ferredoxin family protein [Eubacteriales bacterium]
MAKIEIDRVLCKKCGICAFVCPKQVFEFNELEGPQVVRPDDCIHCDMCIMMCPDMAIQISDEIKEGKLEI